MAEKKRILLLCCSAGLAILGGVKVLSCCAAFLISRIYGGISFPVSEASTIGIIGGADGPTAIFVTASAAPVWQLMLWILLLAVGIYGICKTKRR